MIISRFQFTVEVHCKLIRSAKRDRVLRDVRVQMSRGCIAARGWDGTMEVADRLAGVLLGAESDRDSEAIAPAVIEVADRLAGVLLGAEGDRDSEAIAPAGGWCPRAAIRKLACSEGGAVEEDKSDWLGRFEIEIICLWMFIN